MFAGLVWSQERHSHCPVITVFPAGGDTHCMSFCELQEQIDPSTFTVPNPKRRQHKQALLFIFWFSLSDLFFPSYVLSYIPSHL